MKETNFDSWIDLTNIVDSMQLDSNQVVARMSCQDITATLEVRGSVSVWWNEKAGDAEEGEHYTDPSEFPEKLKSLIANVASEDGFWYQDPRVHVYLNNWFELFVWEKDKPVPYAKCVDAEECRPYEVEEMLRDAIAEYLQREEKA